MSLLLITFYIEIIMCGRYSLTSTVDQLKNQLEIKLNTSTPLEASYNIAPMQKSAVITNKAPEKLQFFQWGLIPHWSKNDKMGAKLINARMESITDKPSFKTPIRKQRCLVLADSFYEWQKSGGQKYPYRIILNSNQPLVMAGIWEEWRQNDLIHKTFSIITTEANQEMSSIHTRMPALLLTKQQREKWLTNIPLGEVLDLIQQPADGILYRYRVSQAVNSVQNNSPENHIEVKDNLLTLF